MLVLVALLLPIVLLFLGFAVDLAYMQITRMELRAAADAAARAGATRLSQTDSDAQARSRAQLIARRNTVAGEPLVLEDSDVEIGQSVQDASGKWVFTAGATPSNAVRVVAPRDAGSAGGSVRLFFGSMIGRTNFEPVQTATASFLNVDICLVLDRSTSMKLDVVGQTGGMYTSDPRFCREPRASSRWAALDAAVRVFIDELRNSDADEQVALATYSSDTVSLLGNLCGCSSIPSTLDASLDGNLDRIDNTMDTLSSSVWNGNTHIEAGMATGLLALADVRYARRTAKKVMIVLTDGNENVGSAMRAANSAAAAGVVVHTVTFSDEANRQLMGSVASATGGYYYHANTADELREVFRELAAHSAELTE